MPLNRDSTVIENYIILGIHQILFVHWFKNQNTRHDGDDIKFW